MQYQLAICNGSFLQTELFIYIIIQIMADQLTHILKQRIDFTHNTLYQNLTIYDTIISKSSPIQNNYRSVQLIP